MIIRNRYKVPKRQWTKWSRQARHTFNETYCLMIGHQKLFTHPSAETILKKHWTTTAWNAAWIAARAANVPL